MVRKLKYHESKLLKKLDFINWKSDGNLREVKILRRYHVQDREDYHTYNKVCGMVTQVRCAPHGPEVPAASPVEPLRTRPDPRGPARPRSS